MTYRLFIDAVSALLRDNADCDPPPPHYSRDLQNLAYECRDALTSFHLGRALEAQGQDLRSDALEEAHERLKWLHHFEDPKNSEAQFSVG